MFHSNKVISWELLAGWLYPDFSDAVYIDPSASGTIAEVNPVMPGGVFAKWYPG